MLRAIALITLLCAGPMHAADAPKTQPRVGLASVVERKAMATQNGVVRTLVLRDALYRNERLSTGAEPGSLLHVRLLDQTVITLGPSSEAVLDDFAVNKAAGSAEVSVKLTRGLLRFVGGQHAGTGTRYRVKTPVATIGVRGTSFDVKVEDSGETTVQLEEGELLFENQDGLEVILDEPDEVSSIEEDGAPSEPEVDESISEEFDSLDLDDEQSAADNEIAEDLADDEIEPIAGEDPDEEDTEDEATETDGDSDASSETIATSTNESSDSESDSDSDTDTDAAAEASPDEDATEEEDEDEEEDEEDEDEDEDLFSDDEDW